jgi:hypothetical protein
MCDPEFGGVLHSAASKSAEQPHQDDTETAWRGEKEEDEGEDGNGCGGGRGRRW